MLISPHAKAWKAFTYVAGPDVDSIPDVANCEGNMLPMVWLELTVGGLVEGLVIELLTAEVAVDDEAAPIVVPATGQEEAADFGSPPPVYLTGPL